MKAFGFKHIYIYLNKRFVLVKNYLFYIFFRLYYNKYIRKFVIFLFILIILFIYMKYFTTPLLCDSDYPAYPCNPKIGWVWFDQEEKWYWIPKDPYTGNFQVATPGLQVNIGVVLPPMRATPDGTLAATIWVKGENGILYTVPKYPQPSLAILPEPGFVQPQLMKVKLSQSLGKP